MFHLLCDVWWTKGEEGLVVTYKAFAGIILFYNWVCHFTLPLLLHAQGYKWKPRILMQG